MSRQVSWQTWGGSLLVGAILLCNSHTQGADSPLADIGQAPEVKLTDAQGRPFDLASLRGKVVLVSFIYTTCNGVCPATTHNLYRIQQKLEAEGLWDHDVEFVSITLDPANDRPEVLARYAEIYGCDPRRWHFVTGTADEVGDVLSAWDMWVKLDERTGVLDHPSRIFLLDLRGRRREIYNLQYLETGSVVADIRGLLAEREKHQH